MKYLLLTLIGLLTLIPTQVSAQPLAALIDASYVKRSVANKFTATESKEEVFQREVLKPEVQSVNSLGYDFYRKSTGERSELSIRAGVSELSKKATAGISVSVVF